MQKTCPFCHCDLGSSKPSRLYGNDVCRSCYWGFALRRHVAFVFDWFFSEVAVEDTPEPASLPIYNEIADVEDGNPYRPPLT